LILKPLPYLNSEVTTPSSFNHWLSWWLINQACTSLKPEQQKQEKLGSILELQTILQGKQFNPQSVKKQYNSNWTFLQETCKWNWFSRSFIEALKNEVVVYLKPNKTKYEANWIQSRKHSSAKDLNEAKKGIQ
jgi:hypothetical protein